MSRRKKWPPILEPARTYARAVAGGDLRAPTLVRYAAERFLRELDAGGVEVDGQAFRFDPLAAQIAAEFLRTVKHYKGPYAGAPFELEPWQCFVVANVFGWVNDDGHRRFRSAFLAVPRGNGKTTLCAALGLYLLSADGEPAPEVYSAAVTRDQAKIAFTAARHMAKNAPDHWRDNFDVEPRTHEIRTQAGAGVFRPLSSDGASLEGLNVHGAILDEIASHKTGEVYDVLQTAMGKRKQPLMFSITTATSNTTGVGFGLWQDCRRILEGQAAEPRTFAAIWEADKKDDPFDPEVWAYVNPSWGQAVQPEGIAAIARQAERDPARLTAFLQRHLNLFAGVEAALFNVLKWQACEAETVDFDPEHPCFMAVDLARRTDLAAVALIQIPPDGVLRIRCRLYVPDEAIREVRHDAYPTWATSGALTVHPGSVIDFERIREDVFTWVTDYPVQTVAFDPWQATQLSQQVEDAFPDLKVLEIKQNLASFSEPVRELMGRIESRALKHDGNPALTWCVSNVIGQEDRAGNIFPTKQRPHLKIDGAIAVLMALAAYMAEPAEPELDLWVF